MPATPTPTSPHPLDDELVADLVARDPRRAAVFERLGIDYCCGGKVPLHEACRSHGLQLDEVRELLEQAVRADDDAERDFTELTVDELVDDIVDRHHARLRSELPRITLLAHKVARAHGARDESLVQAEAVVVQLVDELRTHIDDEEATVFPACRQAADAALDADDAEQLADLVGRLVGEHTEAAGHLDRLRELLHDFEPPPHACTSWRAYLDALARLEQDMHRHVHKENHVLFPKVMDAVYAARER